MLGAVSLLRWVYVPQCQVTSDATEPIPQPESCTPSFGLAFAACHKRSVQSTRHLERLCQRGLPQIVLVALATLADLAPSHACKDVADVARRAVLVGLRRCSAPDGRQPIRPLVLERMARSNYRHSVGASRREQGCLCRRIEPAAEPGPPSSEDAIRRDADSARARTRAARLEQLSRRIVTLVLVGARARGLGLSRWRGKTREGPARGTFCKMSLIGRRGETRPFASIVLQKVIRIHLLYI